MAMKYRLKNKENGSSFLYTSLLGKYSDDSDDENQIPIEAKKDTPTMDYEIEPEDTLQAIALRFHCTIAELKRLNNIMRENEIYARRILRVPVRPHSLLTELIVGVHVSGNSSPTKNGATTAQLIDIDTHTLEEKLRSTCNAAASSGGGGDLQPPSDLPVLNQLIFNSKVSEADVLVEPCGAEFSANTLPEDVTLIPHLVQQPVVTVADKLLFSGDDCGLSWLFLVVLILILGFVCPLIYVFYIAEHPEKFHHH